MEEYGTECEKWKLKREAEERDSRGAVVALFENTIIQLRQKSGCLGDIP